MDYFFCCLRTNDDLCPDQSLLIKDHVLSKSPKPVIYRRPFLPLQINRDDHSACKDSENSLSEILLGGNEERKLKTEDGFSSVCGSLTKTPAKTRKLCGKYKDSSPSSEDFKLSCLSNTFTQSVNMEQHTVSPMTPTEVEVQEPGRNKYVHFKGEGNEISSFSSRPESAGDLRESTPLPYPTPLKLTDEMQTPGTVFPATFETLKNRKYHHIRSQYAYPVHNLQRKSLKEEGSYSSQMTNQSLDVGDMYSPTGIMSTTLSDEGRMGCVDETPSDKPMSVDWNEEEFCSNLPKWLDRNGIQNSDKEVQSLYFS